MTIQNILADINNDFFLDNDSSDIQRLIENDIIDKEAINNKWLGHPPTNEETLNLREMQLGITLPPFYKRFLLTSNGFRFISFFLNNLQPLEKVDWAIRTENKAWLEYHFETTVTDEEYFCYDDNQDPSRSRHEYLKESLKVSDWYDGMCVFLNPIVKHGDEWEVLEYAHWHPGIKRYKTFEEFLRKTHENNLKIREDNNRSQE